MRTLDDKPPVSRMPSVDEPVAEPSDRLEVDGMVRVWFELAAQAFHVDVERPGVAEVARPPDLLDEEAPGEQPALPTEERLEQLELLGGERHDLVANHHLVPRDVHPDRSSGQDLVRGRNEHRRPAPSPGRPGARDGTP